MPHGDAQVVCHRTPARVRPRLRVLPLLGENGVAVDARCRVCAGSMCVCVVGDLVQVALTGQCSRRASAENKKSKRGREKK